jgi:hypothetical protein
VGEDDGLDGGLDDWLDDGLDADDCGLEAEDDDESQAASRPVPSRAARASGPAAARVRHALHRTAETLTAG